MALLYEDGCKYYSGNNGVGYSHIKYISFDPEETMGLSFDDSFQWTNNEQDGQILVAGSAGVTHVHVDPTTVENISTAYVAYDIHLCTHSDASCTNCADCDKAYTGIATVTLPLSDELKSVEKVKGFVVNTDGSITYIYNVENDGEYVTFQVPHFSVVGITEDDGSVTITNTVNIDLLVGKTSQTYTHTDGNYEDSATIEDNTVAKMDVTYVPGTTETTIPSVPDALWQYHVGGEDFEA